MTRNPNTLKKNATLALAIATVVQMAPYASAAQEDQLEEISVTGTRIRVTDGMAAPTPVTSMTPLELANFEPGGTIA